MAAGLDMPTNPKQAEMNTIKMTFVITGLPFRPK